MFIWKEKCPTPLEIRENIYDYKWQLSINTYFRNVRVFVLSGTITVSMQFVWMGVIINTVSHQVIKSFI